MINTVPRANGREVSRFKAYGTRAGLAGNHNDSHLADGHGTPVPGPSPAR